MPVIRIALTKPKNIKFPLVSWIIRLVENTPYSHVLATWYITSLESTTCYESTGSGVNFLCEEEHLLRHEIVELYEYDIDSIGLNRVARFCHRNAGKRYSRKQMFGLFLVRLAKLFGLVIANPFRDGETSQICVETGLLVLLQAGAVTESLDNVENYGLLEIRELLHKTGRRLK